MIIGITGKSGSGKNYFAESLLRINPNLIHIDIDTIGHKVLELQDVKSKLIETFGNNIVSKQGIDRKKLADLVFNNRHKHEQMADITWAHMKSMIDEAISDNSKDYILNWILLPHSHYFNMCDIKYLIRRNDNLRIRSVLTRDRISPLQLKARDNNGIQYSEKDYDYVIINNG